MGKCIKEFKIASDFLYQDDKLRDKNKEKKPDSSNVYTSTDVYEKIFNKKKKDSGTYLKHKKVIKITAEHKDTKQEEVKQEEAKRKYTKVSVYRIWNGAPHGAKSKDIIYLDVNAKYDLIDDEDKDKETTKLTLSKGCKFMFYWKHYDHDTRLTFKLAVWSVFIGIASLVLGIISILR